MLKTWTLLLLAALLGGCASMNQLSSEVSTFGSWPAGQAQPTFVFDRLPSQPAETRQALEAAALPALQRAGFRQASDAGQADYIVQLGASISADLRTIDVLDFHARFGWRGWHYRHFDPNWGTGFGRLGGGFYPTTYLREVAVLVRDRLSGQTVYETRAANSSNSPFMNHLLPAMFEAALANFPNPAGSRRDVVTPIGG